MKKKKVLIVKQKKSRKLLFKKKKLKIIKKSYCKIKTILLLILNIIFCFTIVFILRNSYFWNKYISNYNTNNNILPKLSLNNKVIPSLKEIFNSRILYISDYNLTKNYIRYIRPIYEKEELIFSKQYPENLSIITQGNFRKRIDQYNYIDFAKLCLEEKLLDQGQIKYNNKPIISIVIPSYNKADILLKSIRSIQNQSFKNIEIIIVNDCSTDNSDKIFNYLLKTDIRIRIFNHLKNMGCWRTRIDGILYSRGKYIILFDAGDLYEDNYVLEDAYNLIENYNLDSCKFLFRIIRGYNKIGSSNVAAHVGEKSKIIYGSENIAKFDKQIFNNWGNIWNRLTRANIIIKGLYLLNDYILNFYNNVHDDNWFNIIINKVSFSYLIYERVGYIYNQDGTGEGNANARTDAQKDKLIKEFLSILYFKYYFLPKNDTKKKITNKLKEYDQQMGQTNLGFLKTNFDILYNLLNLLIEDPYISDDDKAFLNKIFNEAKEREKIIRNNKY